MSLHLTQIRLSFGGDEVLSDVSAIVRPRDRVALVGRNGAGKTSLLRIIAGELDPEGGTMSLTGGTRVALHDQRPPLRRGITLGEYVGEGAAAAAELEADLRRIERRMAEGDSGEATLRDYGVAQAAFERAGGYAWRSRLEGIARGLDKLGIEDFDDLDGIAPTSPPSAPPSGVDAGALMERISGVAAGVENDANAMTLGEHVVLGRPAEHMVLVKAGSSIGCGVLADGRLHRGSRGMAGDVSHAAVVDAPNVLCSCGRLGCLDAVAGGAAIVSALRAMGLEVGGTADVIEMARNAHPPMMRLLREAGARTGSVLATIVNFFNPDRLVIAGSLSGAEAFVAGVRSTIYDLCPPMLTDGLRISVSEAAARGASIGAAAAVLDRMLDAEAVDAALRAGRPLRGTRLI